MTSHRVAKIDKGRHQPTMDLPVIRSVIVEDAPGKVTIRVTDPYRGAEVCYLEMTPDQAEQMARDLWGAAISAERVPT